MHHFKLNWISLFSSKFRECSFRWSVIQNRANVSYLKFYRYPVSAFSPWTLTVTCKVEMMIHSFAKSWICNGEPSMSGPSMDLINNDYWNMNLWWIPVLDCDWIYIIRDRINNISYNLITLIIRNLAKHDMNWSTMIWHFLHIMDEYYYKLYRLNYEYYSKWYRFTMEICARIHKLWYYLNL